ncbi:O-antigen ligase family protein [Neobacillus drentensis]|uniref:O-antigen ligase family protein n=1 Tax=Neobacillus drentensis TaxID=220684 RepID=UPI003000FA90
MQVRLNLIIMSLSIAIIVSKSIRTYNHLKFFINALVWGITVSSIVGIGQRILGEPFITLWEKTGSSERGSHILSVLSGRIAGLADYAIPLASQLSLIIPIVIAQLMFCNKKMLRIRNTIFLILLVIATLYTEVRSALIGVCFAGAYIYLNKSNINKKNLIRDIFRFSSVLLISAILYIGIGNYFNEDRFTNFTDESALSRLPMQITAINYALYHPFGTGIYNISYEYIPKGFLNNPEIISGVISNTSHNQFSNMLIYYGFIGLFLLVLLYVTIIKELNESLKKVQQNTQYKWILIGLKGSFYSSIINSLFHNGGPFIGDIVIWFVIGLSIAACKLVYFNSLNKVS